MVSFAATLASPSRSSLATVEFPAYLSVDFISAGRATAAALGSAALLRADLHSATAALASVVGTPVFAAQLTSESRATFGFTVTARDAVEMTANLASPSMLAATALHLPLPGAVLSSPSRVVATMPFVLPVIREPAANEIRGGINLVRNASVEDPDVGLTDWTAVFNATEERSDERAWHGSHAVKVVLDDTIVGTGAVIESAQGFQIPGTAPTFLVGSVSLSGTATGLTVGILVTYADGGTSDYQLSDPFDLATGADEWVRVSTLPVATDTGRTVRQVAITIAEPSPSGGTIWLDGAQIEQGELPTSFIRGDFGEGYTWLGQPEFSMAMRETMAMTT